LDCKVADTLLWQVMSYMDSAVLLHCDCVYQLCAVLSVCHHWCDTVGWVTGRVSGL